MQIAFLLDPIADLASQRYLLNNVVRLWNEYMETGDEGRKGVWAKRLDAELVKMSDAGLQDLLRGSLRASGVGGKPAGMATAPVVLTRKPTTLDRVRTAVGNVSGTFRPADIQTLCPGLGLDRVRKALTALKKEGAVRTVGRGRSAAWNK